MLQILSELNSQRRLRFARFLETKQYSKHSFYIRYSRKCPRVKGNQEFDLFEAFVHNAATDTKPTKTQIRQQTHRQSDARLKENLKHKHIHKETHKWQEPECKK